MQEVKFPPNKLLLKVDIPSVNPLPATSPARTSNAVPPHKGTSNVHQATSSTGRRHIKRTSSPALKKLGNHIKRRSHDEQLRMDPEEIPPYRLLVVLDVHLRGQPPLHGLRNARPAQSQGRWRWSMIQTRMTWSLSKQNRATCRSENVIQRNEAGAGKERGQLGWVGIPGNSNSGIISGLRLSMGVWSPRRRTPYPLSSFRCPLEATSSKPTPALRAACRTTSGSQVTKCPRSAAPQHELPQECSTSICNRRRMVVAMAIQQREIHWLQQMISALSALSKHLALLLCALAATATAPATPTPRTTSTLQHH
jgi:hypothetical protein